MIPESTPPANEPRTRPEDGGAFDRGAVIAAISAKIGDDPRAMVALARQMLTAGDRTGAARLCLNAIDIPSCPAETRAIASELLSAEIPRWHFVIVRDAIRNEAYEAALRRAVFPGCKVLEIGTGSGLLAMMAARAGAQVVTCEADPVVALAAERVIARNGLSDRVRVIARHSTLLDAQADMGGRADILVSEIVSNDLIGEGALPAMEHAVRHLLKPGARIIPVRGQVRVALAEYVGPYNGLEEPISGFDLSPFHALAKPFREFGTASTQIELRSAPHDLFGFDFSSGDYTPPAATEAAITSLGGRVGGTIQWIALDMDETGRYENRPDVGVGSCWAAIYRPFANAIDTQAGETVKIGSSHDREGLRIWS